MFKRYYADVDRVLLLEIDPCHLKAELKVEPSTNEELFPHIYGPINSEAVIRVEERIINSKAKPKTGHS